MNEILGILGVAGLFMLRIGIPVLLLVALGILIDRWQTNREAEIMRQTKAKPEADALEEEAEADEEQRKAA